VFGSSVAAGLQYARVPAQHILALISGGFGKAAIDIGNVALKIGYDHGNRALFDCQRELAQGILVALSVSDIAKNPDSAVIMAVASKHGRGIAVQNSSIPQFDLIATGLVFVRIEILHFLKKGFGTHDLGKHMRQHHAVVRLLAKFFRYLKDLDKPAVLQQALAVLVNDEQAVQGGISLRFQKGSFETQFLLRFSALGNICSNNQTFAGTLIRWNDPDASHAHQARLPLSFETNAIKLLFPPFHGE